MVRLLRVPLAACAFGAALATGYGQTPSGEPTPYRDQDRDRMQTSQLEREDRNFIMKAAKLGAEEVNLSRMAAQRASNPQVKSFAQQLANDHEQANRELTELATRKGVTLSDREKDYNDWSKKGASEFDEDYVKKMRSAHKDAVDLYEDAARECKDAEVVAYARKYLPKLQAHLRHAEQLKPMVD